jgi:hypothetical protein
MNAAPTTQLLTTDQNTTRRITWNVEGLYALSPAPAAKSTWTHWAALTRPAGRGATYTAWVEVEPATGQIIKSSRVVRLP